VLSAMNSRHDDKALGVKVRRTSNNYFCIHNFLILRSPSSSRFSGCCCFSITQLPSPYPLFLDLAIASLASLSAVRRRSVSRLSQICLPRASAISHFIFPFLKYIRVGTRV